MNGDSLKNSPEKEGSEKGKVFMNNFFLYLPGGSRRGLNEQASADPKNEEVKKTKQFIEAMDRLLKEEFSNIDPKEILANMARSNWLVATAYSPDETTGQDKTEEEQEKLCEEARILSEDVNGKLVPLFNRLVEMGFDKGLLMQ